MAFYDKDGVAIDLHRWAVLFENWEYKVVEQTQLNGADVSTVWLGSDHNFFGGRPLIFETMIFSSKYLDLDQYQHRYSTLEEAKKGHKRAVAMVEKKVGKKRKRRIVLEGDL